MRTHEIAVAATAVLREFNEARLIGVPDVQLALTLGRLGGEDDQAVLLAVAFVARALRAGSVCVHLATVRQNAAVLDEVTDDAHAAALSPLADLPWPQPDEWASRVAGSPLTNTGSEAQPNLRPLRLVAGQLYLERYWGEQEVVRNVLLDRAGRPAPRVDEDQLRASLDELFGAAGSGGDPDQRRAALTAARGWTTVVAGGPGTGKTTTISRLLLTLADQSPNLLRVGLAAPTGKAASRLETTLRTSWADLGADRISGMAPIEAMTLHKLLGSRGTGRGFSHGPTNPMPWDVVVVDEMSMVPLSMMARLLQSLRPDCRLVMVGDPNQLTSVEAGAVLADVVSAELPQSSASSAPSVVRLTRNYRSAGAVDTLADAVRRGAVGDALALLEAGADDLEFLAGDPAGWQLEDLSSLRLQVLEQGAALRELALNGDPVQALAMLDQHRLLCAHRTGPYGVTRWSGQVDRLLRSAVPGYGSEGVWYPGRPFLITRNDPDLRVSNGDTGVIVVTGNGPPTGAPVQAAVDSGADPTLLSPYLLDAVETLHAMTVHKSQGSQYGWVTLILPAADSPLLTRELFYTAITRARKGVRVVGTRDAVTKALQTPAQRASGLTDRLR